MMEEEDYKALMTSFQLWKTIDVSDLTPHVLYQKSELTVQNMKKFLSTLSTESVDDSNVHHHFVSSIYLRDFAVLLRDALLSSVKYEQLQHDKRGTDVEFWSVLQSALRGAADESLAALEERGGEASLRKATLHQASPAREIAQQVSDLEIQFKKIYRSHDKVNELRINLEAFKREFHVQFQRQTSVIHDMIDSVTAVSSVIDAASPSCDKSQVVQAIEQLNNSILRLEELQSVESMEVLPYPEKAIINVPVEIDHGGLQTKVIDLSSEMAKWFSANIYPHIIELENRRNLAMERSFTALNKVKVKLSALILDEEESYDMVATEAKQILADLNKRYLQSLLAEEKENSSHILHHVEEELFASSVYDERFLYLPHKGSVPITNISRQATKRIVTSAKKYPASILSSIRNVLGKYVEIDRTAHNRFIANKLLFDKDDERLSLFLKKGYLGKSFTVNRQDLIDPIFSDYKLWKSGFSGSVLIYGPSGSGKSALLGMLSQQQLTDEMITIRAGEPYVTSNRAFSATYDLKSAVQNVATQYVGKKIVLCVDDLQRWHSSKKTLFVNINALLQLMQKYRSDIFFVVSCGDQLRERILAFRSLDVVFSSQVPMGLMSKADLREALLMRFRALPELGLTDTEHENTIGAITRNAAGNVGHAMLEYCRFYAKDYDPNMKSKEFRELIGDHATLLKYIQSFQMIRTYDLILQLSDVDQRDFVAQIDFLVGNKVLVRSRNGVVAINPLLVYSIDKVLSKI